MDKIIGKELLEIVGRENISAEYEDRICYAYDATFKDSLPDVIVKPGTTEEVAKILKLANQYKIPVTPRGAGTGLSGGSVPINGGISLVLTRLNKILKIDVQNRSALVEPGVITEDLQTAVEEKGLLYPPDPASKKISTLGGNVAEGAGGPRGVKYGVTKDYVLGLEVVLPQGDIIKINNSVDGETEDFDYTMLFTASEGTLGIITKIAVKLILPPQYQETVLAAFDNLEHAGETVSAIIRAGIIPTTLEIIDQETIRAVENYLHTGLPTDAAALLLIEVDGAELEVKRQSAEVAKICNLASRNVKVASTKQEIDKLWQARRSISGACGMLKPTKLSEDATVPRSKIPQMIKEI
ncbi:MAG: FAD-binding protein, partial [Opitutales bacterium]|nr:FAD-binding protein [Opitutales bacterium]